MEREVERFSQNQNVDLLRYSQILKNVERNSPDTNKDYKEYKDYYDEEFPYKGDTTEDNETSTHLSSLPQNLLDKQEELIGVSVS